MSIKYKMCIQISLIVVVYLVQGLSSCKKMVRVDPPVTSTTGASVYQDDATAISALTGIYAKMSLTSTSLSSNGFTTNISVLLGLSADELTLYDPTNTPYLRYYQNALSANTNGFEFWSIIYPYIFTCNSAIEGLEAATSLTPFIKQQLLGEAKFMRAFFYFYLVNLYGDLPRVLGTNYAKNALLSRSPKSEVYQQIVSDLKDAQELLTNNYVDGSLIKISSERIRPNKWIATAFLAKVYLYMQDFVAAEQQATAVIDNKTLFNLSTLDNTFFKASLNNNEVIWQLQPVTSGTTNTLDAKIFILPTGGPGSSFPIYLSNSLINSFEVGDQRRNKWVKSIQVGSNTYFHPYKYKVNTQNATVTEYYMVLRLAEQFLIRSEARAQQGKISESLLDLNAVRTRAGLPNKSTNDKVSLLSDIAHERQVELFTEWGHRWLDLKRTNAIDNIMKEATPQKGGTWSINWQWFPLPLVDIQRDPNLEQNLGYQ